MINLSECALIAVVALCVFGPRRLPMLMKHIVVAVRWLIQSKAYLTQEMDRHLSIMQLEENRKKADEADRLYVPHSQQEESSE